MSNFVIVLLIWNVIVMIIYGLDKLKAKKGRSRISEAVLLLCAFFLGGYGAMFGMVMFNHKTSKIKFRILVPLEAVASLAVMCFLIINLNL